MKKALEDQKIKLRNFPRIIQTKNMTKNQKTGKKVF